MSCYSRLHYVKRNFRIREILYMALSNSISISYSMLKSVIANQRKSKGFQSTKTKVLEAKEMERFLNETLDDRWFATKVSALSNLTLNLKILVNIMNCYFLYLLYFLQSFFLINCAKIHRLASKRCPC